MENQNLATDLGNSSDELVFASEDELIIEEDLLPAQKNNLAKGWKVLIVDDDRSVHQATKLALRNLRFEQQPLIFFSAYSATSAKNVMSTHPDIAFILLDVVMETNNSGLELVKYIREELNNKLVRIIIRTGQPGDAPEESIITDYDINDYKLKVELTRNKLIVTAIAALKGYRDLVAIRKSHQEATILYTALKAVKDNLENLIDLRTQELRQEIEERKQVAKTLRLTQFSLDRATDAVYFLNSKARFFYVNEAATRSLGYSKEELLNMTIYDIDPGVDYTNWTNHWQKIKRIKACTFESTHLTKSGEKIPVEITSNYLNFEQQEYNCAIARNITERKIAEAKLKEANEKLQHLAHVDGLTQIANRRSFDQYLQQECQRMTRLQAPLSLIFCDVDYFKKYNDHYGHQAGDDCLKQIAQTINNSVRRPGDLAARYGGEELAIILPNTDLNGAVYVAKTIQQELKKLAIAHCASEVSPYVTLSMGVCSTTPQLELSPDALISRVDRALYEAKKAGRDRYFICPTT